VLLRRRAIVCRQAVELVTDYLEGALSRRERARLEAHLAACPHCSQYLEQIRATIAATARVEPATLSRAARRDLVALYRAWQAG
jgi:anti-sigma factor RsiW